MSISITIILVQNTGKNKTDSYKTVKTLDPKCTNTTKSVVGLLQSCNLVGRGIISISITIILVQNFFLNYITWKHFVVAQFTL